MEISPVDPRQGQPVDATVPHATDTVLPDLRPGVQQPTISPAGSPDSMHVILPKVSPGEFPTGSKGIITT